MLRVDVGGNASGFYAELNKAKAEAAKFSQQMDEAGRRNIANAQTRSASIERQIVQKQGAAIGRGVAMGNAASQLAGFAPPQVAAAVGVLTTGFFALKETAMALGLSFIKTAGAVGAVVFGLVQTSKLLKENYDLYKATNAETKSLTDEYAQSRRTLKAYDQAILDAQKRGKITEDQATKLRVGIRSNDFNAQRAAYKEVRGFDQGMDPKLRRELARAMATNMPDGRQRDLAIARLDYREKVEDLGGRYKDARQVDKPAIAALARQAGAEFSKSVRNINAEWDKKDEDAKKKAEKAKPPEKPMAARQTDSMSQVGLLTRQFLASGTIEDLSKKQLAELRVIARNTKPATAFINPFQ